MLQMHPYVNDLCFTTQVFCSLAL